jgi:hypothetical protein
MLTTVASRISVEEIAEPELGAVGHADLRRVRARLLDAPRVDVDASRRAELARP